VFAGSTLTNIKIINGKKLPDKPAAFSKLKGKVLKRIYRSGKEMRFEFADGSLLGLHLMLTGDVFIFEKKNEHHSTIAELYFDNGKALALADRMKNAHIKLDPVDKKGVDALSPQLNFKYLKQALQRKTNIKKVLTDQDAIRGIGNSYSDEILWAAKISPNSVAEKIPDEKIKELVPIIKKILKAEIKNIFRKYPGKVNVEVKEFLKIHTKQYLKSPTGAPIIIDTHGMMKTYFTREQKLYK
ncbi:MAG: DNA-formamidopyrimidine glycosylase family protein, partial [Ferruginibacter sp.]